MTHGVRHLRFSCTQCGHCCRDLRVPLTAADVRQLPAYDGALQWLAPDQVNMIGEPETFVQLPQGRRLLVLGHVDGACVFLKDNRCSVYASRPRSCRLYPFDVTLGRRAGVRRLKLLSPSSCEGGTQGWTSPQLLAAAKAAERQELEQYVRQVFGFNRIQAHRRRLHKPLLPAEEFLRRVRGSQVVSQPALDFQRRSIVSDTP